MVGWLIVFCNGNLAVIWMGSPKLSKLNQRVGSREQEQQAYMLLPGHDGLDLEKKRTLVCVDQNLDESIGSCEFAEP
jgi:hypothetical protein